MARATGRSRADRVKEWVARYSEEEQASLLIIVGVVLFLFPEPITSAIGVFAVLIGAMAWLSDWLRG